MTTKKGGLVIPARPQVSVEMDEFGEIIISVASIGEGFDRVEMTEITFPGDCVESIAKALLDLVKP